jgi:hypothetical protein
MTNQTINIQRGSNTNRVDGTSPARNVPDSKFDINSASNGQAFFDDYNSSQNEFGPNTIKGLGHNNYKNLPGHSNVFS